MRQESDAVGGGGHEAQRGERVPVPPAAHAGRVDGDGDVLGARHPGVAEALCFSGHDHDVLDAALLLPRRGVEARVEVHNRGDDAQTHRCPPRRPTRPARSCLRAPYGARSRRPSWRLQRGGVLPRPRPGAYPGGRRAPGGRSRSVPGAAGHHRRAPERGGGLMSVAGRADGRPDAAPGTRGLRRRARRRR